MVTRIKRWAEVASAYLDHNQTLMHFFPAITVAIAKRGGGGEIFDFNGLSDCVVTHIIIRY